MKKIFMFLGAALALVGTGYSQTFPCKQVYYPTGSIHVNYRNYNTDNINNKNALFYDSITSYMGASVWTWNGEPGIVRSLLNFDLSAINNTSQTTISNADLYLYNESTDFEYHAKHGTASPNKIVFNRITSAWQEKTVTWNTQPTINTATNATSPEFWGTTAVLPENRDNFTINLNNILLSNGKVISDYKGISFRQYDDRVGTQYRRVMFASRRYANKNAWPKLEVEYKFPLPAITFDGYNTFKATNIQDLEAIFSNVVYQWVINGDTIYGKNILPNAAGRYDAKLQVIVTNTVGNFYSYSVSGVYTVAQPTITCKQVYYATDDAPIMYLTYNTGNANNVNHVSVDPAPEYLGATIWTWSGEPGVQRSLISFDLSAINNTSQTSISNVDLYLYNSNSVPWAHSKHGSTTLPNKIVFNRVTSSWQENTITWNNQPTVSTATNVMSPDFWGTTAVLPENRDDLTINLNNILLNNGTLIPDYKGISLRQYDDRVGTHYRTTSFASHRNANKNTWPKLEVEYKLPRPNISFDGFHTFQVVNNYDLETLFSNVTYKWTINGNVYDGNTAITNLQPNNTIALLITLTNNIGGTCQYTISGTLNYSFVLGETSITEAKNIIVDEKAGALSALENEFLQGYSIYPNPANDQIRINNGGKAVSIAVVDMAGKCVLKTTINGNQDVSVKELKSGMYICYLFDKDNKILKTSKLSIVR